MIEAQTEPTQAEREAAQWFTRMLTPPIENEDLAAFEAWRRNPDHLAAYNRMEDISRLALSLRSDPDMRAAATAMRARARTSRPWWSAPFSSSPRRWAIGIAFAGLAAASAVAWKISAPTYETNVGRQMVATLSDGTRVRLNTDSALKVRFERGVRRVDLRKGQAFFDVAHDPGRPFIVAAGDTEVRAIGTRFDVRRDEDAVKIVLAEGKVAVTERDAHPSSLTLAPGESVTTSGAITAPKPVKTDVAVATGWTSGRLKFRATPLAQAVDEVNRYTRNKIVLSANAPADARVNGDFAIGKPDEFISAVSALYGLRSDRRFDGSTELRGPAG